MTHFVAGVGTGGTITGVGRYLREQNPAIEIIGADPVGSIYSGGEDAVRPYLVEGVGEDFWPDTYDPRIVDRYVTVSDRDSFLWTRRLAETEGILAGGLLRARSLRRLPGGARARRPRGDGRRDPSGWRPFLPVEGLQRRLDAPVRLPRPRRGAAGGRRTAPQARRGEIPPLLTVESHAHVRDAVALLHEHRVSQLPVVSSHDPHTVVGSVSERGLLRHAMDDPALPRRTRSPR